MSNKRLTKLWFLMSIFMVVALFSGLTIQADNKTTLQIWTSYQPGVDPVGTWLQEKCQAYEKANPNVKIDLSFSENQSYKTKLQVAMFGNAGPDIFNNWGGESEMIFARQGLLYDFSKDLGSTKWGLSKGLFATHTLNNKIYGLPLFPAMETVWYNKDMFAKNGWKPATTWSELLELCEKAKMKGITPIAMAGKETWTILQPYMYMADRLAGAKLYADAKAGKASFGSPEFIKAFELLQNLAKKGDLPTDVLSLGYNDAVQLMVQDKAAMIFMGNWVYAALTSQMTTDFDKWGLTPFPAIEGGKGDPKAAIGAAEGFSINKSCKAKAAAVKFLKFLYARESQIEVFNASQRLVALSAPYMSADTKAPIKEVAKLLSEASSLTQWWDQDLSGPMTQAVLQSLPEVIAGAKSPKDAAQAIENAREKK